MSDNVNHPAHYAGRWSNGAELIDITEHLDYCRGNAVKYLARAGYKNPDTELEDLEKAQFYVNRAIENFRAAQSGGIRVHVTNTGDAESRPPRDFQNFWLNEMTQAVKDLKIPRPGQVFTGWDGIPEGWVAECLGVARFEVDGVLYLESKTRQCLDSGAPVDLAEARAMFGRDRVDDAAVRLVRYAPELVEAVRAALKGEGEGEEETPLEPGSIIPANQVPDGWHFATAVISMDYLQSRGHTLVSYADEPTTHSDEQSAFQAASSSKPVTLVRYDPEPVEDDAQGAEASEEESSPAVEPQAGEAVDRENPALGWIVQDCEGDFWRVVEEDGQLCRRFCLQGNDLDNPGDWSASVRTDNLAPLFAPYTYVRPVSAELSEEKEADEPEAEELKPGDTIPSTQVPDGWYFTIQAGKHLDYLQWQGRTLLSKDYGATTPSSPEAHFQAQRQEREATLVRQEPERISAEKIKIEPLDASKITVPPRVGQEVVGWENVPEGWVATFEGVERIEVDGELYLAELIRYDIRNGRPINLRVAAAVTRPTDMEGKAVRLVCHAPELAQAVRDTLGFQKVKAEIDEEEAQEVKAGGRVDPENPAQDWIIEDDEGDFWKFTEVNGELRLFLMEEEAGTWDDGEGWEVPLSSTFAPYTYVSPVHVEHFDDLPAGWWWQREKSMASVERQVDEDGKIWAWARPDGGSQTRGFADEATLRREEAALGKYVLTDRAPLKREGWDK